MKIRPLDEMEAILKRKLTVSENAKASKLMNSGMVNPYDLINVAINGGEYWASKR